MSGPIIKIPIDDRPWDDLNGQIKQRKKDLAELEREVKKVEKAGQKASKDTLDKIKKTEGELGRLNKMKASQGADLKATQNYNQQYSQLSANNDHVGMLRLQAERRLDGFMKGGSRFGSALNNVAKSVGGAEGVAGLQGIGAGLRGIAGPAAAVLAAGNLAYNAEKFFNPLGEDRRTRQRDYNANLAQNQPRSAIEMSLMKAKKEGADWEEDVKNFQAMLPQNLLKDIPVIGGLVQASNSLQAWAAGRISGKDYISRSDKERQMILKKSNVLGINSDNGLRVSSEQQRALAQKRYFDDKYGKTVGALGNFFYDNLSPKMNDTEKGINDQLQKNVDAFNKLKNDGFSQVENNDFVGAAESLKLATKEIAPAAKEAFKTPEAIWFQLDAGKTANINYYWSQSSQPTLRIGQ